MARAGFWFIGLNWKILARPGCPFPTPISPRCHHRIDALFGDVFPTRMSR
jgi:hypothetical protein